MFKNAFSNYFVANKNCSIILIQLKVNVAIFISEEFLRIFWKKEGEVPIFYQQIRNYSCPIINKVFLEQLKLLS